MTRDKSPDVQPQGKEKAEKGTLGGSPVQRPLLSYENLLDTWTSQVHV